MWIEINKDIFETSEFKSLNYLYQILSWFPNDSIPRYKVFIDLEKVKNTDNYKKLKGIEVLFDEFLNAQFDEFINISPQRAKSDYKITKLKKNNHFNVEEAIRFFNQPVSIILENNKNDSSFIIAIINYFDNKGVVKEHLKNNWIKFENAGGCSNIGNFLDAFLKGYDDLAVKNNRELSDYFRGMVILDSDLEYPTQSPKHTKLIDTLTKKGITNIHVLEKRMMENYMPDEIFKQLRDEPLPKTLNKPWLNKYKKWINVYLNLNDVQKNHLKITGAKISSDNHAGKQALYNNLSPIQKTILNDGFYFINADEHKNKFPLLFIESTKVNKHTLNQKCGTGELQDIFGKILELL